MSNENRRKLLKSIAAGSGAVIVGKNLPDSWSRPVVDAVMLPAHAQTSARYFSDTRQPPQTMIFPDQQRSLLAKGMDSLVPKANAGSWADASYACISILGNIATIHYFVGPALNMARSGQVTLGQDMTGSGTITMSALSSDTNCSSWVQSCGSSCTTRPVEIDASNEGYVIFRIEGEGWREVHVYPTDMPCEGNMPTLTGDCDE